MAESDRGFSALDVVVLGGLAYGALRFQEFKGPEPPPPRTGDSLVRTAGNFASRAWSSFKETVANLAQQRQEPVRQQQQQAKPSKSPPPPPEPTQQPPVSAGFPLAVVVPPKWMDTDVFVSGQRVVLRYRNLNDGRVECDIHGDVITGATLADSADKYVSEHVWGHPGVADSGWRESMPIRINGFTFFRRKKLFRFWSETWLCPDGEVVSTFRDSESVYKAWVARGRVDLPEEDLVAIINRRDETPRAYRENEF